LNTRGRLAPKLTTTDRLARQCPRTGAGFTKFEFTRRGAALRNPAVLEYGIQYN
jgi:hypothetical protein